uniref:Uncharacterized protein n=1 Tax=Meloidogyne hapla TaxID=6305 RepID=A0A1I8BIY2_MELHA
MKLILLTLFFAHCSNSLFKDTDVNLENLPEYSEFIKQLKPSTTPLPLILGFPNGNLPTIQLCKESPGDDLYGHIFCWGMIGLYFVLILSLFVYQLRSFFWGCFPCDRPPPRIIRLPCVLIINLDSHESGGSHWIALIYKEGRK